MMANSARWASPPLRDRIVQEALRAILDPIYESDFHPHSYGFRKGRCTMDAIAVLMPLFNSSVKHYYVIEGDLQSYFDTVHHRTLMKLLRRRLKDRALLDLLWKFLEIGRDGREPLSAHRLRCATGRGHLPTASQRLPQRV